MSWVISSLIVLGLFLLIIGITSLPDNITETIMSLGIAFLFAIMVTLLVILVRLIIFVFPWSNLF